MNKVLLLGATMMLAGCGVQSNAQVWDGIQSRMNAASYLAANVQARAEAEKQEAIQKAATAHLEFQEVLRKVTEHERLHPYRGPRHVTADTIRNKLAFDTLMATDTGAIDRLRRDQDKAELKAIMEQGAADRDARTELGLWRAGHGLDPQTGDRVDDGRGVWPDACDEYRHVRRHIDCDE